MFKHAASPEDNRRVSALVKEHWYRWMGPMAPAIHKPESSFHKGFLSTVLLGKVSTPQKVLRQIVGDPAWAQTMADAMGAPITVSRVGEATSRGAALLAFKSLGQIADLSEVPAFLGKTYAPDPETHEIYVKARARQSTLYTQTLDTRRH